MRFGTVWHDCDPELMERELERVADLFTGAAWAAARRSCGEALQYFLAEAAFGSIRAASGSGVAGWVVSTVDHESGAVGLEMDVPKKWDNLVPPTFRRLSDLAIMDGKLASFHIDGLPLREFVCPLEGDGATGWLLARTTVDVPVVLVTSIGLSLDGSQPPRGRGLEITAVCEGPDRSVDMLCQGWALHLGWCADLRFPHGESMPIADVVSIHLEGEHVGTVLVKPQREALDRAESGADEFEVQTGVDESNAPAEMSDAIRRRMPDATIEEVFAVEELATELLRTGRTGEPSPSDLNAVVQSAIDLLRLDDAEEP